MQDIEKKKIETRAIHAGQQPDPSTGAIMTPVYLTSTFVQSAPGVHQGYDYARVGNPTRTALEGNLASLEGAKFATAFSSGVAATDAIIRSLPVGSHILSSNDLYGGSYRLFRQVWEPLGYEFDFIDMRDIELVTKYIKPNTKLLWLETPTNPLIRVLDVKAICDIANSYSIDSAVDNTFATPYLQNPLSLGASLVMHSTTKYIGGHSDVIGGAVCTNSQEWDDKFRFVMKSSGAAPGPMDCYLLLRGTKTLPVRMDRHCSNAMAIAKYLEGHSDVGKVHFPGLANDPGHEIAKKQMKGFGGMVSFVLKNDSMEAGNSVMSSTEVFSLAESLGGVESLINHPATMTHASIPREQRIDSGLVDSLIRLSVGIENVDDLISDLDQAIASSKMQNK